MEFKKPPQPKIKKDALNCEALIAKDRAVIEARLRQISGRITYEQIPGEPNIGKVEGLYGSENIFSGLSGLKKIYMDKCWTILYIMPKLFGRYLGPKGGKRFRPLLLLNGYRTFSHRIEPSQKVIDAAVGLELLHETALILDDVIDNSKERRGVSSLWFQFEEMYRLIPLVKGKEFGDAGFLPLIEGKKVASDIGSLSFSWARHLMVDVVDKKNKSKVGKVFWQAVADMKRGEEDDSRSALTGEWPPIEHVLEQFYLKTSSYSMRLPLLYALHTSGATIDDNILKGVEDFSRGFGIAFQLHDDLLITKTTKEIGKDSNLDIFNGTKIPIAILARQFGSDEEKVFIDKVWGKPAELTTENIVRLKKIFKTTGALQRIVEMTKLEIQKAESGLNMIAQSGFDVSALRYLLNTGLPWIDDFAEKMV